ncbi:F-box domain-containing protein [Favolaschia claudopus]|uniref:F-box domain-containing protein n=1 Tax=Favolaschia claudopus TaxID=2862362 RepID=A0AAW0DQU8_9AGAR
MSSATTILSLPNELLIAVVAAAQLDCGIDEPINSRPEWILSHLCRHFRRVIIAAPALWTNISISLKHVEQRERLEEIFKLFLRRSVPLNVAVSLRILSPAADATNVLADYLSQVVPEFTRMQSLSVALESNRNDLAVEFVPLCHLAAPNLLHLDIANISPLSTRRCPVELFSIGAPKLSSVRMRGFFPFPVPSWISSTIRLELDNVGQLLNGDDTLYLSVIMQPLALVYLRLDLSEVHSAVDQIRIPSLECLSVTVDDGEDGPYVVNLFDCPALTEFTFVGTHGDQILWLLDMPYLRSSYPVLHTLSFINTEQRCHCETSGIVVPTRTHFPEIPLFPALSSLVLINQCFTRNVLKEIFGTRAMPWPCLKTLALSLEHDRLDVRGTLRDTVRHSSQTIPKLRLCRTLFSLEEWEEGGVDVEVFDPEETTKHFRVVDD